jgi:ribulose-5-phosphate 4-epimerase/fuculose-1-phosphate aldolase
MDEAQTPFPVTREAFSRFCILLYDRHLVAGVGGNMAARYGDKILISPSGYAMRDVTPENAVTLNAQGAVVSGGIPTKDLNMHLAVLRIRPDVNVVCHVHGVHLIAASTLLNPGPETLPPLTPGFVYFAHPLPMIPFLLPGSEALAREVARELASEQRRAVLLQNHGLVTVGRDFQEAINAAEEIDEAARIFLLTRGRATAIPLDDLEKIR